MFWIYTTAIIAFMENVRIPRIGMGKSPRYAMRVQNLFPNTYLAVTPFGYTSLPLMAARLRNADFLSETIL